MVAPWATNFLLLISHPAVCVKNILNYSFQPPKKKGGKKGKKGKKKSAKAKTPTVIDGVSTEEMTKEQVCV